MKRETKFYIMLYLLLMLTSVMYHYEMTAPLFIIASAGLAPALNVFYPKDKDI